MDGTPERLRAFGEALGAILDGRPTSAAPLGAATGTSKVRVDSWLAGRSEPSPAEVFAIDEALNLAPGCLSRQLGYLPVGIAGDQAVEDAISSSNAVDADGRQLVLGLWCTLVAQAAVRRRDEMRAQEASGNDRLAAAPIAYSLADTATLLGVSLNTVRRLIERERLPTARLGNRVVIRLSAIEALLGQDAT